jgi:hypothetical protein
VAKTHVQTYVVAVRRECRAEAPLDWVDMVRRFDGVVVQEPTNSRRLLVEASESGIAALRRQLSGFLHIEPIIHHEIA